MKLSNIIRFMLGLPIPLKIFYDSERILPEYRTCGASAMDITHTGKKDIILNSNARKIFPTGIYVEIPQGFELQVRSRSSSYKSGLVVLNSPGTIDSDYRGEIGIIMINQGGKPFRIKVGERLCQIALQRAPQVKWLEVESKSELSVTGRGTGGFGSTGRV